jgi:type II secretory pathway pseudopilin PulG
MKSKDRNSGNVGGEQGFSAIEMMVALVLIMAVIGVVVKGMTDMQRRGFSESSKMDSVQDARDFIDQMVRDVHDVGYPPPRATVNNQPYCTDALANGVPNAAIMNNPNIACGIIRFSPTLVIYEADLDGTGTVSSITLQLVPGPGNTCPCILQRGVLTKAQFLAGTPIQYFTTVNGVLNSGNGAGGAIYPINLSGPGNYVAYRTTDVFAAYDANATPIAVACSLGEAGTPAGTNPDCSQIRSLQIAVNVAPNYADPTTRRFPVFSITSKARINF